jgi:hypothetical protein
MQIQPIHRLLGSQKHGQLQLCVPPVTLTGDSYRTRARRELLTKQNRSNQGSTDHPRGQIFGAIHHHGRHSVVVTDASAGQGPASLRHDDRRARVRHRLVRRGLPAARVIQEVEMTGTSASPVTVRVARPEEGPAVAALLRESYVAFAAELPPDLLRGWIDDVLDPGGATTLVALADGTLAGTARLHLAGTYPIPLPAGSVGVRAVAVAPARRRSGVAPLMPSVPAIKSGPPRLV